MATATEPGKADAAGYVDFDEFIEYQLTRTRNGIKSTDLLTALIGGAAAVLAYILVFALFDHWIIDGGFSTTTRAVLLSLLVLGLIGWTIWKLVLPYFRTVTPLYAARQIELTRPELHNSLLTLVDLKRAGRPVPEAIEASLEKRSALNLSEMDVEQAVDRRLLMRLSYVLFALVVLTCAYVLFSPKKLSNSLWRALLPASTVSVATRTQIDNVSPGDVQVLARAQLTVTADLSGEVPKDVTLLFTTADRRFVDEPVAMRQSDEGLRRFGGVITGENGAGILQNLTYRVQAGDARSPTYHVTVKQPPSASVQEVAYEYPSYMGLDPRTQPGGAIDAWEGTWVGIRAKANMPLSTAMILFSDSEDTSIKAEEFPAELADGVNISARWQLKIRSDGTHPAFYRIQCRNEAGETDIDPTLYPVKIHPDLPPRIELAQPTGDIERPANAIVPLLYAAQDQDFLLRSVVLHLELNGDALPQQPRLYQAPPFRRSVHDVHNLELEALNLNPGDHLTYWIEARDNMEPFADRSGNRANTPKLNITITEPASPEQVQKQLDEDQQQLADKLEEARRQDTAEPGQPQDQQDQMPEDSPPPPNDDQPSPSADEPQPTEAGDRSTGQGGATQQQQQDRGAGASQNSPGGEGQEGGEPSSDGSQRPQDGASGSDEQPDGEEAFDNLLKELMQREQQRQQQSGGQQPPQGGQQQASPDAQRQPQDASQRPSGTPQENQPGQAGTQSQPGEQSQTGQPSQPGQTPPQSGESGTQPPAAGSPSAPGETSSSDPSASDAPADAANGSSESMKPQQPSTGEGTNPTAPSPSNVDAPQQPGAASGGQPTSDPNVTPPADQTPSGAPPTPGGQKQPGTDPTGAKPGDGNSDTTGTKPQPAGTRPPDAQSDQPGPRPGEPADRPDAKTGGQPDGPDQPMQGPGREDGQRSDSPQSGEAGSSQQTSQGTKGGDQQGPGDSTGRPGAQESSQQPSQQSGRSGSQKTGAGGSQQSGGNKPGGESQPSPSQPGSGAQPGQSSSQSTSDAPGAGSDSEKPGMTNPPASNDPQQPSGQDGPQGSDSGGGNKAGGENKTGAENKPAGQSDAGGEKPAGGPQNGGQQTGGQESQDASGGPPAGEGGEGGKSDGGQSGGQPGQGASPSGGPPGAPPSSGSPSGPGGGTRSDGGQLGTSRPDGHAGGEEHPLEAGNAAAGEGTSRSPRPDEVDLEAKKQAANLVLQRLQDQLQRGEIDPDLQKDLNLTPERLQEFTQKLEQRLAETAGEDTSPDAQARRRQFEETLRTIDFDSTGTTREGGDGPRESSGGFSGPTRQAPPELRDAARQYRERMMRRQSSSR